MRDRQDSSLPQQQQRAAAPVPAPAPLPLISFDVHAFLGDDPPAEQLLQSLLEAPPASVPAAQPPAAPVAAAGQTAVSAHSKPTPAQRALLTRARRYLETVRLPAGVPQTAASLVLIHYALAQRVSTVDGNM